MAHVADFMVIRDEKVTLGSTGSDDTRKVAFDLDSPHGGSRAILFFNIDLDEAHQFEFGVSINETDVFRATYSGGSFFSIHEVVPARLLKQTGNILELKRLASNGGSIEIGDIVLFYQQRV